MRGNFRMRADSITGSKVAYKGAGDIRFDKYHPIKPNPSKYGNHKSIEKTKGLWYYEHEEMYL